MLVARALLKPRSVRWILLGLAEPGSGVFEPDLVADEGQEEAVEENTNPTHATQFGNTSAVPLT
jgi:hypothetical protein